MCADRLHAGRQPRHGVADGRFGAAHVGEDDAVAQGASPGQHADLVDLAQNDTHRRREDNQVRDAGRAEIGCAGVDRADGQGLLDRLGAAGDPDDTCCLAAQCQAQRSTHQPQTGDGDSAIGKRFGGGRGLEAGIG